MHKIQQKILELARREDLGQLSLREIGEQIGEGPQPQKIKHHLDQLKRKGLLKLDMGTQSLKISSYGTTASEGFFAIPILGSANCGEAIRFAEALPEGYLKISKSLFSRRNSNGVFALRAIGHSMNKALINEKAIEDGDYVLVDSKNTAPSNGDYVLSIIDGCANIKRYIEDKSNKQVVLMSESSLNLPPIFIHESDREDYMVNGVVMDVIKRPNF